MRQFISDPFVDSPDLEKTSEELRPRLKSDDPVDLTIEETFEERENRLKREKLKRKREQKKKVPKKNMFLQPDITLDTFQTGIPSQSSSRYYKRKSQYTSSNTSHFDYEENSKQNPNFLPEGYQDPFQQRIKE